MAGERVLLVEDNVLNMELARELLLAAGFVVLEAGSAEQGLELARSLLPDVILMDIRLPGMDGITAVRQLKAEPATASIPVVALSAQAMRSDLAAAQAAGCTGFITKPIATRSFATEVTGFLARTEHPA